MYSNVKCIIISYDLHNDLKIFFVTYTVSVLIGNGGISCKGLKVLKIHSFCAGEMGEVSRST